MTPITMHGIAAVLRRPLIEVCFLARMGRLPRPIGRDEYGHLLFDLAEVRQ